MSADQPADTFRRYSASVERYTRERDEEARRSVMISRLRLATFIPAAVLLVATLVRGATPLPLLIAVALFVAYGALVTWHARVEDCIARLDALRIVNLRAIARLHRDWAGLPAGDPPPGVDLTGHPYAQDLDIFGRASLFQWLGPAATAGGSGVLADWLLHPANAGTVGRRQQAVDELAPLSDWREGFAAEGVRGVAAGAAEVARFLRWAEGPDTLGAHHRTIAWAVAAILSSFWILFVLWFTGRIEGAIWAVPLLAGLILWFAFGYRIEAAFNEAGGGQQALSRYASLFDRASAAPHRSPLLASIRARLSADGLLAPACMRQLNRLLSWAELRRSAAILHVPIQILTLWDFHILFMLERWRRRAGGRVRGWLEAVSELDALAVLAGLRADNPSWAVPEYSSEPIVDAEALGHPLIPDDRRVANDVSLGPPGTLLLITGSNMSGKSTLLRAIGLTLVLAQAGAVVCARRFRLPESDLQTSIRVQDSLELGLSYFMAALARLKGVVDAAEHERPGRTLVYLLDEILQGTNSVERGLAVRAVARHLLEAGAIGAMTTHDLALAQEDPLNRAARLVHFAETVDQSGQMRFEYKLMPGLATSRNALRLMQLIGIDV